MDAASVYTPEALALELEAIVAYEPNVFIVGSLGRAVVFAQSGLNPTVEFDERGEQPLIKKRGARDIDTIGLSPRDNVDFRPFYVDRTALTKDAAAIVLQNGDWFLVSEKANYSQPLHPDVMEPVVGETIFGIECRTVSLQTHAHLFELFGVPRAKDNIAKNLISGIETSKPQLPTELYKPFDEIRAMNDDVFATMQRAYWRLFPKSVRLGMRPFTQPIKHHFGR